MNAYNTPFEHFDAWYREAEPLERDAQAVHLATADATGRPSGRMVLSRRWSPRGFEVQTNLESRKILELRERPWAALTWYWASLDRQVRVEGAVEWLTSEESDEYWRMRSRDSQLSALASDQSQPIEDRAALLARRSEVEERYRDAAEVPRLNWGGLRVAPFRVEFFQDQADKLQDRLEYHRAGLEAPWETRILQP